MLGVLLCKMLITMSDTRKYPIINALPCLLILTVVLKSILQRKNRLRELKASGRKTEIGVNPVVPELGLTTWW